MNSVDVLLRDIQLAPAWIIERFSEDFDLSIERPFLGFGGDSELKSDYAAMQPMFFSTVLTFASLVERLRRLEAEINKIELLQI